MFMRAHTKCSIYGRVNGTSSIIYRGMPVFITSEMNNFTLIQLQNNRSLEQKTVIQIR